MRKLNHKRILLSPLNWGLGHATRLIPVIRHLEDKGHFLIIAAESPAADVLKEAFPHLNHVELPGFRVRLSSGKSQWIKLALQIPQFLIWEKREYNRTQKLVKKHNINLIISDNRYGVRSKTIPSIIMTHQTSPYPGKTFSFLRPLITQLASKRIKKFNQCWIPDVTTSPGLSGHLSHNIPIPGNTFRIGLLSRFSHAGQEDDRMTNSPDILVIISGPEPHRSLFENAVIKRFASDKYKVTLIQGKPQETHGGTKIGQVTLLSHCNDEKLYELLSNCKHLICRSGYSTIMDLVTVNRRAILVPTPGQYEQEYLAQYLTNHFGFSTISQDQIHMLSPEKLSSTHLFNTTSIDFHCTTHFPQLL